MPDRPLKMAPTQPNSRWFWTTVPTRHGDVDPIFWSQQLVQTSNLRALVSVHRDNNTLILHLVQRRTNRNLASMFRCAAEFVCSYCWKRSNYFPRSFASSAARKVYGNLHISEQRSLARAMHWSARIKLDSKCKHRF